MSSSRSRGDRCDGAEPRKRLVELLDQPRFALMLISLHLFKYTNTVQDYLIVCLHSTSTETGSPP